MAVDERPSGWAEWFAYEIVEGNVKVRVEMAPGDIAAGIEAFVDTDAVAREIDRIFDNEEEGFKVELASLSLEDGLGFEFLLRSFDNPEKERHISWEELASFALNVSPKNREAVASKFEWIAATLRADSNSS